MTEEDTDEVVLRARELADKAVSQAKRLNQLLYTLQGILDTEDSGEGSEGPY